MTSMRRPAERTGAPARPTARAVGILAGLVCVATAVCAVLLVRGHVDLSPSDTARLFGESTRSAGLALALVVVLPMAVAAIAGWRNSPRTGELAALAGAALIGAGLVQIQVIRLLFWLPLAGVVCGVAFVVLGLLVLRPSNHSGGRAAMTSPPRIRAERPPRGGPRPLGR